MPVPKFDESIKAEKLPLEVLKWLNDAAIYARFTPGSADEVFSSLKLVLRLLAVRNPNSQSHATRKTFGFLIESICQHPDSEKACIDLLDFLVRICDGKQNYRYNPMKHLSISGLGHLSKHLTKNMRQMAANVFVICIEALKIAPIMPQTLWYRNTIIWTLTQSAATAVDESSIKTAYKMARNIIESSGNSAAEVESVVRSFDLLTVLVALPKAKFLEKKLDSIQTLTATYGLCSPESSVRNAAAGCFSAALLSLSQQGPKVEIIIVVNQYLKLTGSSDSSRNVASKAAAAQKRNGYSKLLECLISKLDTTGNEVTHELDEWLIPVLLQLNYELSSHLIVDVLVVQKMGSDLAGIDALKILLRQLALAHAPSTTKTKKSKSKNSSIQKPSLESTLLCLGKIIGLLGNAIQPVATSVHQSILGLVLNSSTSLSDVQLGLVVICLRLLTESVSSLIITTVEICLKQLEVNTVNDRRIELAYVIGAMIGQSKRFPLYGDVELNNKVLLLGISMVRKPSDLTSYRIGWLLLDGVFCLGSQVMKSLVSQLIVLWKTHLGPEASQSMEQLEYALTGLTVFLDHNLTLLTPDFLSRISDILYTLWSNTEGVPVVPQIRRRLLQCYDRILKVGKLDIYPASLVMKYIAHTTNPGNYSKTQGVLIESAIFTPASSLAKGSSLQESGSSSFSSVPKFKFEDILDPHSMTENGMSSRVLERDPRESVANDIDALIFFGRYSDVNLKSTHQLPTDVSTTVVDLALSVVSQLLPLQPERIQESVLDSVMANLESDMEFKSLRGIAVTYNIAKLVRMTLNNSQFEYVRVLKVVISLLKRLLSIPCPDIQKCAVYSCGIIARALRNDPASTELLSSFVKDILETSVSQGTDADVRSSYILALGYIAEQWPNPQLLDAMFKILMPMAAHPDPKIHLPTMASMRHALLATEMVDQKYVKCVLKTLGLTMLLDSHNNSAKFRLEVAESLVLVVSCIGPLLSTERQQANRDLIVCLVDQLQDSSTAEVRVMAWKSFIELYYYARQGINWSLLIRRWRDIIISKYSPAAEVDAAVNGLLILMKISVNSIFSVAGSGLEDALWLLLDQNPKHPELRAVFLTWLEQTSDTEALISAWLNKISAVVMKPRYFFVNRLNKVLRPKHIGSGGLEGSEKTASVIPTAVAADEDVTLDVKSDESNNDQFLWEARAFAIDLLLRLLHRDVGDKSTAEKKQCVTTKKVGDIIKISFSSATSQVMGLQHSGLALLNEIIVQYGGLADPDFPQISLLEQYQIQITSAISPAFSRDSTPSVALSALQVCATFLTSEVIKSKEKLSRLIKVLEVSLESMKTSSFKLGDLDLTVDATKMFKVVVLAVWAEMQNHASTSDHLREIIEPFKPELAKLWADTLYDYGRLRSIMDSQWSMSSLDESIVQMKETQMQCLMQPIHKLAWVSLVRALSSISVDQNADSIINPLVLSGLCFHALIETLHPPPVETTTADGGDFIENIVRDSSHTKENSSLLKQPSTPVYRLSILKASEVILTPKTCELVITSTDAYFEEIVPVLYRVMLNGIPDEQNCVLVIARNLVAGQPETDDSVDHFFEILKVAMLPLRTLLPQVFDPSVQQAKESLDADQVSLLQNTMDTLIDITQVFREIIQNDLWLCLLKIFEELNHYEPAVAAPCFKKLLEILATQAEQRGITFIIGALTASLRKAVQNESTKESLLVCSALTCTNSRILLIPAALHEIQRFGERASSVLQKVRAAEISETDIKDAEVALQCITAVMKVCAATPSGGAFAFGCFPGLIRLAVLDIADDSSDAGTLVDLRKQALKALVIYSAFDGSYGSLSVSVPVLLAHFALVADDTNNRLFAHQLLLQLAQKQPAVFKETVWRMNESDRNKLQVLLAHQIEYANATSKLPDEDIIDDEEEYSEIELKSFV